MPRKEKPPARRPKPENDNSPMYTTSDLRVRYRVSRRTLRRWTAERGFPEGRKTGKEVCYGKEVAHTWERIHMPELHPTPVEPPKTEEDKHWDRLRKHWLIDKEELAARPPLKSKRAIRAART